jgi:hypothetical protein
MADPVQDAHDRMTRTTVRTRQAHFELADRWLRYVEELLDGQDGEHHIMLADNEEGRLAVDTMTRIAQVHATLAVGR